MSEGTLSDELQKGLGTGESLGFNGATGGLPFDALAGAGGKNVKPVLDGVIIAAAEEKLDALKGHLAFLARREEYSVAACTPAWYSRLKKLNALIKENSKADGPVLDIFNGARLPLLIDQWSINDVYNTPRDARHRGMDITGDEIRGTPVYAVESGIIIKAVQKDDPSEEPYGNCVYIYHKGKNVTSHYAHLQKIDVTPQEEFKDGAEITKGQLIGKVGNTGKLVTGIHLHFAIYEGKSIGDPADKSKDPLLHSWI